MYFKTQNLYYWKEISQILYPRTQNLYYRFCSTEKKLGYRFWDLQILRAYKLESMTFPQFVTVNILDLTFSENCSNKSSTQIPQLVNIQSDKLRKSHAFQCLYRVKNDRTSWVDTSNGIEWDLKYMGYYCVIQGMEF